MMSGDGHYDVGPGPVVALAYISVDFWRSLSLNDRGRVKRRRLFPCRGAERDFSRDLALCAVRGLEIWTGFYALRVFTQPRPEAEIDRCRSRCSDTPQSKRDPLQPTDSQGKCASAFDSGNVTILRLSETSTITVLSDLTTIVFPPPRREVIDQFVGLSINNTKLKAVGYQRVFPIWRQCDATRADLQNERLDDAV